MHSPSLWYETEARNFLMIIFLRNIKILYLECVSTNDYMLILCCLALFGPTPLFVSFCFSVTTHDRFCHTCHGCVTYFRPILGNIVEVTLMTFPILYIVSHAKGTSFP